MENLSHSRHPSKSAASLSKKACNGGSFIAKTTYDDVFGGAPKFGPPTLAPRVDDYTEIFGGFHAPRVSSIPVLDLPVADEEDVFFDVRSSGFDYDEVFGGLDGLDGAVSFEELMVAQSNGVNADVDSCEEAWTPVETESLCGELDHSGKNQGLPSGDSYDSVDGSVEFNISYHKANQRIDGDMSNGITHVSQLHAALDKSTPLEKAYYENPSLEVTDDSNFHMDFGAGMMRERNLKKTLSQPSNSRSGDQIFSDGLKPQREYTRNNSLPAEMFVTVSEISLRTQPTEVPPPCRPAPLLDVKKGDCARLAKNSKVTASEAIVGDTSPPFYDVEVDASSSAAASAAAMKEAMEKAQAKLKTAKALLERKREGVESRKHHRKGKEKQTYRTVDDSCSLKEKRLQDIGMESSVREERQDVSTTMKAVPDSLEAQESFNMDKLLAQKHGQSDEIDGAGQWNEETQFFELVKTERSTFECTKYDEVLVPDTKQHDCRQKIKKGSMEAAEHQQRKIKETCKDPELGENEKYLKFTKDTCDLQGSNGIPGASKATGKHKGENRVKVAQEVTEQVKDEKKFRMPQIAVEIERKLCGANEPEEHENLIKVQHKESRCEGEKGRKHREDEQPLKETNRNTESESRVKASCEREVQGRKERDALEQEENEKKFKADLEQVENEKKGKDSLENKDKDRRLRRVPKQEDNEKKLEEVHEGKESEKVIKEVLEQMENEKKQREAIEREDNERGLKKAYQLEKNDKQPMEPCETEEHQTRVNEALEKEEHERREEEGSDRAEIAKRLEEACEIEKMERRLKEAHEKQETGKTLEEVCEKGERGNVPKERRVETENWLEDACEAEDLMELNKAHEQTRVDEYKKPTQAKGLHMFKEGGDLKMSDKAFKLDDNENSQVNRLAGQHEDKGKKGQATQGAFPYEESRKGQTECRDDEMVAEAVETTRVPVDRKFEVFDMASGNLECEEYIISMTNFAEPLCNDYNEKRTGESREGTEQVKTKSALQMDSDARNQGKKYVDEWEERENKIKLAEAGLNQEDGKDKFMPTQLLKESVQNGRITEAAQPSALEGKQHIQQTAQAVNASQFSERKERNISEVRTSEEKEAERMKRERELENERLRRLEEEREREREREKDRMAVDIATLEAREKTYAEAHERKERSAMERATAEARQRALAEARERLDKACAEAKEKSLAEKASMEARLRAERAAVERATAEARERAVEKAMAERAAFEVRERVDRTFSEKFSASSRNTATRSSSSSSDLQDQKFQSASSVSGSRYPYSSGYSASYNIERYEGVEGESAQRCKARLERHRRTAERAAKALAEKNMRDLLAQREQAERNRLAEMLDADVKRWSSGKEGNLRALLSTLQYILGPDSGWHPIPLTEVITSAAVKKAYRKATLCVHPDKLQQRGASIQQKYICEKVFDLLKEAWNKFNSEER